MTSEEPQIAQQYPYSVKIEQTALGARVSAHSYSHIQDEAVNVAIWLYAQTRMRLEEGKFKIAPEEPTPKKEGK